MIGLYIFMFALIIMKRTGRLDQLLSWRPSWDFKQSRSIVLPPGTRLHVWTSFFYSRKTMERVFQPMLADMRDEYYAALAEGRIWKARWVRCAYYWAFLKSIGLHSLVTTVKEVASLWKLLT